MIHTVRTWKNEVKCPICSRPVIFTCVWFDTKEQEEDYAQSEPGEKGEDEVGDRIAGDAPEVFAGKWITCSVHRRDIWGKLVRCKMSGHAPEDLKILAELAERIKRGDGNPPRRPEENEVAVKSNATHRREKDKKPVQNGSAATKL